MTINVVQAEDLDAAVANRGSVSRVHLTAIDDPEAPVGLELLVAAGRNSGPMLWIQACLHGDEPGAATLARDVIGAIDLARLKGTVVAVPVGNPPAYMKRQRTSPIDRADVNRIFPGDAGGGHSARLAAFIWSKIGGHADALVDIHSSNLDIHGIEHVLVVQGDALAARKGWQLGEATRARFLCPSDGGWLGGTLFREFTQSGRPGIFFDRGNIFTAEEFKRQAGNLINVMAALDMIDGATPDFDSDTVVTGAVAWLSMPCDGEVRRHRDLGERFEAGDLLAEIVDLAGTPLAKITAPKGGVVVARSLYGYMLKGEGVFLV